MKQTFKTAVPYALAAGTLALALGGCGTFDHRDRSAERSADRYADRTVDRRVDRTTATYVETNTAGYNAPAVVDPFSPRYAAFPPMAPETAGVSGHSFYCTQHYNQPGCQTFDTAAAGSERHIWGERHRRSDAGDSMTRSDASRSADGAGRY